MSTNPSHRLIGLDPGLRFTGWGVIDVTGPKLVHVANGSIASKQADALPTRLLQIENGLEEVFDAWGADHAGVEQTFVNRDGAATLKLGQARAVCLLVPARRNIPVHEYAPNFIKRAVTGSGHAAKEQIAAMIKGVVAAGARCGRTRRRCAGRGDYAGPCRRPWRASGTGAGGR